MCCTGTCDHHWAGDRVRLRFGVDGFPYVVGLSTLAALLLCTGAPGLRRGARLRVAAGAALAVGAAAAVPVVLGIGYTTRGKFALRERVVNAVVWRGDEVVVDLGAGAGLLALAAAARTSGSVICVDLFIGKDLSGNTPQRLRHNAEALGVADRVQILQVDVRDTGLPDASVDVVLSSLCLHNLPTRSARTAALAELRRVVRPGGTVVITDLGHVDDEYAPYLGRVGMTVVRLERVPGTFPPQRLVVARLPESALLTG